MGNYSVVVSNLSCWVSSSNAYLTVLDVSEPLGDGIPNWWKFKYGLSLTDPTVATNHLTGDRLTYFQKYLYGLDPTSIDTDGDNLSDYDEIFIHHTNPLSPDTDGDGITDDWEVQHGLNPLTNDATRIGPDGVSNLQIYQYNLAHTNQLDAHNPFFAPGTSVYEVINNGQHTNRFYYDREDRLVGMEASRGISIAYSYDGNGNLLRQAVLSRAGETNGLPVLWQFLNGLTNGTAADGPYSDADGDGWNNYQEWLAGTDPNNRNSQPTTGGNTETAPYAVVLPSTNALGGVAVVTVRLWDNEANASTPFLQYQILGWTNWQDATIYALDGAAYSSTNRVAALPGGVNHAVAWNAMNDLGAGVATNVLLRAGAQDFMLVGDWSLPTPFQVNMTQDANTNGIPDWWEYYYLGSLQPGNADYDHDGFSNYAEYIADTNPTDSSSYLRITSAQVSTNGVQINWSGGSQARQYLQRISSVGGTNTWVNIQTVQPPTAINGSYVDGAATNGASFYRIRVQRP
jgi:YD repeat-containing protein